MKAPRSGVSLKGKFLSFFFFFFFEGKFRITDLSAPRTSQTLLCFCISFDWLCFSRNFPFHLFSKVLAKVAVIFSCYPFPVYRDMPCCCSHLRERTVSSFWETVGADGGRCQGKGTARTILTTAPTSPLVRLRPWLLPGKTQQEAF